MRVVLVLVLVLVAAAVSAYAHGDHAGSTASKPTTEERAAFEAAKPAFERHCFRCHTTAGEKSKSKAMRHLDMDSYPFGGHHAHEVAKVVREVLGLSGNGKVTMPSDDPGSVRGNDLRLITAWADAFEKGHPRSATDSRESGRATTPPR